MGTNIYFIDFTGTLRIETLVTIALPILYVRIRYYDVYTLFCPFNAKGVCCFLHFLLSFRHLHRLHKRWRYA